MRRIVLSLTLALALAGCNGVPIATQWKLRNFKLESADLSKLRVAVKTSDWLTPTPDRAVMTASHWREGAENEKRELKIHLQRGANPEDQAALAQLAGGGPLTVYEIAARELPNARAFQAEIQKLRAEGVSGSGGVGFEETPACRNGAFAPGPLLIDAYFHPDDEIGWLPLLSQFDVAAALPDEAARKKLQDTTPPCGKLADRVEPPKAGK